MLLPLVHGILIRSLPESGLLWRTNVVYALTRCVTATAIRNIVTALMQSLHI